MGRVRVIPSKTKDPKDSQCFAHINKNASCRDTENAAPPLLVLNVAVSGQDFALELVGVGVPELGSLAV